MLLLEITTAFLILPLSILAVPISTSTGVILDTRDEVTSRGFRNVFPLTTLSAPNSPNTGVSNTRGALARRTLWDLATFTKAPPAEEFHPKPYKLRGPPNLRDPSPPSNLRDASSASPPRIAGDPPNADFHPLPYRLKGPPNLRPNKQPQEKRGIGFHNLVTTHSFYDGIHDIKKFFVGHRSL